MIVLGLDIASATGAAFDSDTPGVPRCVTFRAPRPEGDSADGFDCGDTFAAFHRWLADLIAVVKPTHMAFEAPLTLIGRGGAKVMTNQNTVYTLMSLAGIAEMTARELIGRRCCYQTNVATVKKFLTGDGRAEKHMMIARCRQLGWPVNNDHEADACGVWAHLRATLDPKWAPRSTPLFARTVA